MIPLGDGGGDGVDGYSVREQLRSPLAVDETRPGVERGGEREDGVEGESMVMHCQLGYSLLTAMTP